MMAGLRALARAALAATLLLSACSSPSSQERIQNTELAQLAPLKQTYSGTVMGFDFQGDTTLIVSIDIQNYIGMDDDASTAMKRAIYEAWRSAWGAAHPHQHAIVRVRLIDFVGRKIAEQSEPV